MPVRVRPQAPIISKSYLYFSLNEADILGDILDVVPRLSLGLVDDAQAYPHGPLE